MSDRSQVLGASGWRRWALPALFFVAVAPTLHWSEFSSGSENLNVGTALEIRRTGRWLFPTLQGQPRIAKPPLSAWITAACITDRTMEGLSSTDAAERRRAFERLTWEVRWPALLAACLGVLAVHEMGRILGGVQLGIVSALVYGTTYAFLRFSRISTTDVQLTLWVLWANVFLLMGVLEGRRWRAATGAGVTIALAFMSKGPVSLVQTVVPVGAFALWLRWMRRGEGQAAMQSGGSRRGWMAPALLGLLLFAGSGLPWFAAAAIRSTDGQTLETWRREILRDEATGLDPSQWYNYLVYLPLMLPWLIFLVGGVMNDVEEIQRDRSLARRAAPIFLVLIPVLIMSLFRDRKDRYLLPMIGPGAVIAGQGLLGLFRSREPLDPLAKVGVTVHWCIVGAVALLLPIAGATSRFEGMRSAAGGAWFSPGVWIPALACSGLLLVLGLLVQHRRRPAVVTITVAVMLVAQGMFAYGYGRSRSARSEMRPLAEAVLENLADAELFGYRPNRRTPEDLALYLNRTVNQVKDPGLIKPADRPQVLFTYRRREESITPPAGWRYLTSAPRGENFVDAFYRLPSGSSR